MVEFLSNLDVAVFFFINQSLANPVTDFIMPVVTSDNVLRVGYAVVMILVLIKGEAKLRWMVLFSLLTILIADQFTAGFVKNIFDRLRPCHALDQINLLVGCGSGYSMPSAHAANAFAQASLWSRQVPGIRTCLYSLATLIALSRVFVGVHYPSDILVGAAIGTAIGLLVSFLYETFDRRINLIEAIDGDDN